MDGEHIRIRGARAHNLKGVDVEVPRGRFVVITGVSGSGKSSLAFDTIFAEGQRRYVESLSTYARQFLEQMPKPDADSIEGLPPTISIEQRTGSPTPRSTVATSTEIYDYLRVLFARAGHPFCHRCRTPIRPQTPTQVVNALVELPPGTRLMLLAPVVRGRKGAHKDVLDRIKKEGFLRARVDGVVVELKDVYVLDQNKKHNVEVVVDRLVIRREAMRERLSDSVETALRLGDGILIAVLNEQEERVFSEKYACPQCGLSFGELHPRLFSFNSPYGACPECDGLGTRLELDPDLVVADPERSLADGAIEPFRRLGHRMAIRYARRLREYCTRAGIPMRVPFRRLDPKERQAILYGDGSWPGVLPHLMRRFETTESEFIKRRLMGYMSEAPCNACGGARLRPEALSVRVAGRAIHEVTALTVDEALHWIESLSLTKEERKIAQPVVREIRNRLRFLQDVGLGYLTLDRRSATLAGGEAQRIRLASQVGSGLVGVCYVLDEPTIGLHPRDNARLIGTLKALRDLGNTLLVVEHDEDTIRAADWVLDLGPGAGEHGGRIVAQGTPQEIAAAPQSVTGRFLSGREEIPIPARRRAPGPLALVVRGAREHNLKNIDVRFPLNVFTCVTGVSGSGKSTLVSDILYRAVRRALHGTGEKPGRHDRVEGVPHIARVAEVDQSPIGRSSRSNPATYCGAWQPIRELFAMTREARMRGYAPGRFSFNVRGGRCEACEGMGTKVIEMHFLPDVYVTCEECGGRRFNAETLDVRYKGKNIAEVLDMSVEEALSFFHSIPKIARCLQTLDDVGLGYIRLGQPSTTLSGGEAQRVKLAAELIPRQNRGTLYVLDEPTTGLHFADIRKLLGVLDRLVEMGNTVIVIEHNLHVIKCADWVIDLGPEGGEAGGHIVAEGTPEQIAEHPESHTGRMLRPVLARSAVCA